MFLTTVVGHEGWKGAGVTLALQWAGSTEQPVGGKMLSSFTVCR